MTTILLGKECSPFLEIDDSLLQRAELRLVWAESVDAFVPLAREHAPQLVVLDPQVPGFDAVACATSLRNEGGLAEAVILVVGNRGRSTRAAGSPINGIVTRPVTQERLLDALRRHGLAKERDGARVEVAIKVEVHRGGGEELAYTRDLAVDGCFLHTHEAFAQGEAITLSFQLPVPAGRSFKVEAEVVRVEPGSGNHPTGIALRFVHLLPADRVELGRFLRKRGRGVA